jgi:dolichol kinase
LYPPAITVCVSLLVATDNPAVILPNIVLAVCSWPQQVVPRFETNTPYDSVHWALTCVPIAWSSLRQASPSESFLSEEDLTLLYPLHQILCVVLHHLTTTSLLTAELQLFSIALINVLVLASSPQIQILKALLWVGGVSVLVLAGSIIKSGIILARVPKWRFRKIATHKQRSILHELTKVFSWRRIKSEVLGDALDPAAGEVTSSDSELEVVTHKRPMRVQTFGLDPRSSLDPTSPVSPTSDTPDFLSAGLTRRHTLSYADGLPPTNSSSLKTASGRRRRAISVSVRPFLKLTYTQSVIRKWLYALYVYLVLAGVIIAGVRVHIQKVGLHGTEPIGFALGYMLGDWPWFRFQVVKTHLGNWIPLPPRPSESDTEPQLGWVQHIRHYDLGEANTRLAMAAYWFTVFVIGLLTVFRLKEIYEVDTRRKVFHFMMVGILLPATFVDPTFCALALALILAIFLMLDLLRASQLPPLSKPIASFLAPYVDGRDFRGPVVISHIFLLIGCAIPLWLALAALPRTGEGYLSGWEVPTREVSMVSGVICVGLGDAAASLIGRRYGRRKWIWGGGKSLEGSLAFAIAVFAGLTAATIWLRLGGWPMAGERPGALASARNAAACGSMASLTEAVLTGGNDNVIVPVVLWTCVKSLSV